MKTVTNRKHLNIFEKEKGTYQYSSMFIIIFSRQAHLYYEKNECESLSMTLYIDIKISEKILIIRYYKNSIKSRILVTNYHFSDHCVVIPKTFQSILVCFSR